MITLASRHSTGKRSDRNAHLDIEQDKFILVSSSWRSISASSESFHLPVTKQSRMLWSTSGWLQSLNGVVITSSEQSLSCKMPLLSEAFMDFNLNIPPIASSSLSSSSLSSFLFWRAAHAKNGYWNLKTKNWTFLRVRCSLNTMRSHSKISLTSTLNENEKDRRVSSWRDINNKRTKKQIHNQCYHFHKQVSVYLACLAGAAEMQLLPSELDFPSTSEHLK